MHALVLLLAVGVIATPLTKPVKNYREERSDLSDGQPSGLLMPGDDPYPNGNAPYFGHNDEETETVSPHGTEHQVSQMVVNAEGCPTGHKKIKDKCVLCGDGQVIAFGSCIDKDK
ncbi:hypothetical protein MSG28_013944 [Choristoneura fumiferana]|uniref:Uncharacterized protein n=1 Tax=Choristoneura fumiferana TaxID=7141 RepID=A0ACC0K9J0_CHOFU|nr:hypothetical protein MSG28_013944 [Choristoneura fumiferana]